MAASPLPSPQQQLAEVEEAARRTGLPVLVQAAWMGRHDVLAHLLHVRDSSSATPATLPALPSQADRSAAFLTAAQGGHELCLRVLLEASPLPSSTAALLQAANNDEWNALMLISGELVHVGCMRLLLQHSPDAQVTHRCGVGLNALMLLSVRGQAERVALLLQHSPDTQVAAVTEEGDTAATLAAEGGHLSCLQLLLQHSPQLQRLDEALVEAAQGCVWQLQRQQVSGAAADEPLQPYQRCVELLLSKGAMMTTQASPKAFAHVRRIIQDLAARTLVPDMAVAAAEQAVPEVRHGRKRGHARGSSNSSGGTRRQK